MPTSSRLKNMPYSSNGTGTRKRDRRPVKNEAIRITGSEMDASRGIQTFPFSLNFCFYETSLLMASGCCWFAYSSWSCCCLSYNSTPFSGSVYSSALSIEAAGLSSTLWPIYHRKLRRISEDLSNFNESSLFSYKRKII